MKKFQRNAISVGLLSVLIFSMVFFLTGCGFLNQGPTAKFTYTPSNPNAGDTVNFDASSSSDPNGSITQYQWDFNNDGNWDVSSKNKTQSHSFSSPGNYKVTLQVTDDGGSNNSTSKTVEVSSQPKLNASFTMEPDPAETGESVTFDGTGSTGTIDNYEWDLAGTKTTKNLTTTHTFHQTGSKTISLTIYDGTGDWSKQVETLMVVQTGSS